MHYDCLYAEQACLCCSLRVETDLPDCHLFCLHRTMPAYVQPLGTITNVDRGLCASPNAKFPRRDCPRPSTPISARGPNPSPGRSGKTIRVFVRIRPQLEQEDGDAISKTSHTEVVLKGRRPEGAEADAAQADVDTVLGRSFSFEHVFGPEAQQREVYEKVASETVNDVFNGYHGLIFVYGQTGTGKTYTLCNHQAGQEGMLVQAVQEVCPIRFHKVTCLCGDSPPPLPVLWERDLSSSFFFPLSAIGGRTRLMHRSRRSRPNPNRRWLAVDGQPTPVGRQPPAVRRIEGTGGWQPLFLLAGTTALVWAIEHIPPPPPRPCESNALVRATVGFRIWWNHVLLCSL